MFDNIIYTFTHLGTRDFIDIFLVAVMFYFLLTSLARIQALPVIRGFLLIFVLTLLTGYLKLQAISAILTNIISIAVIAIFVLYPAEVRKILYSIGRTGPWGHMLSYNESSLLELVESCKELAANKTGALVVIENNQRLQVLAESGQIIDANLYKSLLTTIFQKQSILHDGAVVIRNNKIFSASCIVSNLSSKEINPKYGTRHRAGLGLSEQTDAFVIIISEERGTISLCLNGKMTENLTPKRLENRLKNVFLPDLTASKNTFQKSQPGSVSPQTPAKASQIKRKAPTPSEKRNEK